LTTPNIRPSGQPPRSRPPERPSPASDFDRTSINAPIPRSGGGGNRPNPPGNSFDLTSVNFTVPEEFDEDEESSARGYAPDAAQRAPQPRRQTPDAYQPSTRRQTPPAPPDARVVAPKRRLPAWAWLAAGALLSLLIAGLAVGAYFFLNLNSTFTLKVINAPQNSKVFIDDVPIGVSQADGAILAQGLRAGEQREVRVSHEGFADWRTTVRGEGGELKELRVRLTPLTEAPARPAEDEITKDLEEMGRARIYGINFDPGSDAIKDDSKPTLDKIVGSLKKHPEWKLTVEGHTDSTSNPEYNQQLSERRAQAVKGYLQANGVEAARLNTVGYGASRPVADNNTALGRALNRRVELFRQ
jgi:outer membrane protein OmpA-like peptidoglycan-associated protein